MVLIVSEGTVSSFVSSAIDSIVPMLTGSISAFTFLCFCLPNPFLQDCLQKGTVHSSPAGGAAIYIVLISNARCSPNVLPGALVVDKQFVFLPTAVILSHLSILSPLPYSLVYCFPDSSPYSSLVVK